MKQKIKFSIVMIFIIIILNLLLSYKFNNANIIYRIQNDGYGIIFYIIAITISLIVFILSFKIFEEKQIKTEKVFLYIVPIFAILMTLAMPVGTGHDEAVHLYRTYEISEGVLNTNLVEGKSLAYIPKEITKVIRYNYYSDSFRTFENNINYDNRTNINIPTDAVYSPIQFIPNVLGMLVGKLITKNVLIIAYTTRIMNIIICSIFMYFSIKKVPFGKNLFLIFSILPSTIEGISTISPDGFTISICMFFIAAILQIAYDESKKVDIKNKLILLFLCIIISQCKIVYLPLVGLLLIIPKEKFKSQKDRIITILCIFIFSISASLLWLYIANPHLKAYTQELSSSKINMIISEPLDYIQKVLYTISQNGNRYIISAFGGELEWGETIRSNIIPYILFIMSIICSISDKNIKNKFTNYQKTIMMLIILAISILIFTSLFIQWADKTRLDINGVQGRYFIPILPCIFMLISQFKINIQNENDVRRIIGILGIVIQLYIVMSIVIYHLH